RPVRRRNVIGVSPGAGAAGGDADHPAACRREPLPERWIAACEASDGSLVVVPVFLVRGVPVTVVQIVEVVAVPDRVVAAAGAVLMAVSVVRGVSARLALVVVPVVLAVQMPVVRVVDVVPVGHLGVSAAGAVGVLVGGMLLVEG